MGRKCFISFKKEDIHYKEEIQKMNIEMIDYSLDEAIDSKDEEYIIKKLREDYISKATVLIHLIGTRSRETLGFEEQKYIKRELQAALYDGIENTKSGILGIVLPSMYSAVYAGSVLCQKCFKTHTYVNIDSNSTINEFSYNFYIPNGKCSWPDDDRYCVLVKWDDFVVEPEKYIESAFVKRSEPISKKPKLDRIKLLNFNVMENEKQKTCFVIIGFGQKKDYPTRRVLDLDKTFRIIIKPVFEELGYLCYRANDIVRSGIADIKMYENILKADFVIADLSTLNPNVMYELGIRHALRPFTTIVIAEDKLKDFPFDINHVIVEKYEHLEKGIDAEESERFKKILKEK